MRASAGGSLDVWQLKVRISALHANGSPVELVDNMALLTHASDEVVLLALRAALHICERHGQHSGEAARPLRELDHGLGWLQRNGGSLAVRRAAAAARRAALFASWHLPAWRPSDDPQLPSNRRADPDLFPEERRVDPYRPMSWPSRGRAGGTGRGRGRGRAGPQEWYDFEAAGSTRARCASPPPPPLGMAADWPPLPSRSSVVTGSALPAAPAAAAAARPAARPAAAPARGAAAARPVGARPIVAASALAVALSPAAALSLPAAAAPPGDDGSGSGSGDDGDGDGGDEEDDGGADNGDEDLKGDGGDDDDAKGRARCRTATVPPALASRDAAPLASTSTLAPPPPPEPGNKRLESGGAAPPAPKDAPSCRQPGAAARAAVRAIDLRLAGGRHS